MKIVRASIDPKRRPRNVFAAENLFEDVTDTDSPPLDNDADVVEEDVVDEDMGEDGQQDGSTIEIDNNIFDHLIAECQNCHGIFISAMIASDQDVQSINGVCPLCSKETEQFFIGIIKPYPEDE